MSFRRATRKRMFRRENTDGWDKQLERQVYPFETRMDRHRRRMAELKQRKAA